MRRKRGLTARSPQGPPLRPLHAARVPVPAAKGRSASKVISGPGNTIIGDTASRAAGWIGDAIVIGIVNAAIFIAADRLLGWNLGGFGDAATAPMSRETAASIQLGIAVVVSSVYFLGLWTGGRFTLGMRLVNLRVARALDGNPVRLPAAVIRWSILELPAFIVTIVLRNVPLGWPLDIIVIFSGNIWLIVLLVSIARSPTRQGYHDRAAHTVVVYRG